MVRQITELGFFEKIIFFEFGGHPKAFYELPKTVFSLIILTFGGVILLKLFDPSYGFGATDGKIALFWQNQPWKSPKLWLRSKSFRSMIHFFDFGGSLKTFLTPKDPIWP